MRIVDPLPRAVREIENLWVPVTSGGRLAARVFLPVDAEDDPVPAVIEYNPYRKRDLTASLNEPFHGYLAGHGFAGVRLEIRGSGESDGTLRDEYLAEEQRDAVEAIAWLARQAWCTGSVGMIGNSWAGFAALQVAALQPPALRAIVTSCSTDDRYADDMHYMGGCLLTDTLDWGSMFQALLALPPDPALVGDRWRDIWRARLDAVGVPLDTWLRHQRRDEYWRHGSVCEDYSTIRVPVLAVGGWVDGYSNSIPRLLARLSVPRRGIVGPWAHMYPHTAVPGPGINFLNEVVRWFDHWLKGIDNGVMAEPLYRVWMAESVPAAPSYSTSPGRWVAEDAWPSERIVPRRWQLGADRLESGPTDAAPRRWRSPAITGVAGGEWCPYGTGGRGPEFPNDQREDDGRSLTWDSPVLPDRLEILGAPLVELDVAVDRPAAFVCIRLCDVAPDGASTRVSYGLLNLSHRDGHERLAPMAPGQPTRIRIQLNDTAYAFAAGHRIRLAVSTDYWPMVWPSPQAVTLTVFGQQSWLELPVRPPGPRDEELRDLGAPESGPLAATTVLREGSWRREVALDLGNGRTTLTNVVEGPLVRFERTGRAISLGGYDRATIREDDRTSASAHSSRRFELLRDGNTIIVSADIELTCTRDDLILDVRMVATEDDRTVWSRRWNSTIARDHL